MTELSSVTVNTSLSRHLQHSYSTCTVHSSSEDCEEQELQHVDNEPTKQSIATQHINSEYCVSIKGIIIMLVAALIYSALVVAAKWASILGFGSMQILLVRATSQAIIAVPFSLITFDTCSVKCGFQDFPTKLKTMDKKVWILVLLRGIFGALGPACYFEAIVRLPIGDAIAIFSMFPIPTAFVAYFGLKEHISCKTVISLALCIVGTLLIIHPQFIFGDIGQSGTDLMIGYLMAISAALIMSIVFILIRLAKSAPPTILIISQGISSIIVAVILGSIFQEFSTLNHFYDYLCMILIAVSGYASSWCLTKASQIIPASLASMLRSTSILWSYLWQIIFFHHIPNYLSIIGGITIFTAILTVSIEKIKYEKSKQNLIHKQIK